MKTFYSAAFGLHSNNPNSEAGFLNDGYDRTLRHIHHLAMRVLDPPKVAKFYQDVFELKLAKETGEDGVYHLTDGVVTFEILPWKVTDFAEAGIVERPNLDHVGFEVESIDAYKHDLE